MRKCLLTLCVLIFTVPLMTAETWLETRDSEFALGNFGVPANVQYTGTGLASSLQLAPRSDWWNPCTTPSWWDTSYRYRKQVTISNNSTSLPLPDNYTVSVDVPFYELISQGKLQYDGDDLKIMRYAGDAWTEIERVIDPSQSLWCDGTDNYAAAPNSSSLDLTTAFTVEAWIYPTAISGATRVIAAHIDERQAVLSLVPATNRLVVYISNRSVYRESLTVFATNQWYHVAAVYEGSSGTLDLYVNGQLSNSTLTGAVPATLASNTDSFAIGSSIPGSEYFQGKIDEVRLSKTRRYTSNFTAQAIPFASDTDTAGLWHFDETGGNIAYDSSDNGNNCAFYGNTSFTAGYITSMAEGRSNKVWFRTPTGVSVTQNGYDCNYYMYYGNPFVAAPAYSPSNVFLYYEDFESYADTAALGTVWSLTSSGTASSGLATDQPRSGFQSLRLYDPNTSSQSSAQITLASVIDSGYIIEHFAKPEYTWDSTELASFNLRNSSDIIEAYQFGEPAIGNFGYLGTSGWVSTNAPYSSDQWYRMSFVIDRTAGTFSLFRDTTMIASGVNLNLNNNTNLINISTVTNTGTGYVNLYIDDIRIRKYVAPGATTAVGGEFDWQTQQLWSFRQQIFVQNAYTSALAKNYSAALTFDHAALVTLNQSLSSGDDIRVVYQNGNNFIELNRAAEDDTASTWNTSATRIWFRTPAQISASTSDTNYYLYYGMSSAVFPPAAGNSVFLFYDNFESGALNTYPAGFNDMTGSNTLALLNDSTVKYGSKSLRLQSQFAGSTSAGTYALVPYGVTNYFSVEFWAYGDVSEDFGAGIKSENSLTGNYTVLSGASQNNFVYKTTGTNNLGGVPADATWYRFVINRTANDYAVYVYDSAGASVTSATGIASPNTPVYLSIQNLNPSPSTFYSYFDNFKFRKFITTEPTTSLAAEVVRPYNTYGVFTSQIYDTTKNDQQIDSVAWSSLGGLLTVDIRASNDKNQLTSNALFGWITINVSGEDPVDINDYGTDKGRFMQYRLTFSGSGQSADPTVSEITVGYNLPPNSPVNSLPFDNSTAITLSPTLQATLFSDPNTKDQHKSSHWQIRLPADTSYTSPVYDVISTDDLTSITVPANTLYDGMTYYWRVAYMDQNETWASAWGEYSAETSFSINLPDAPPGGDDDEEEPPPTVKDTTPPLSVMLFSPAENEIVSVSPFVSLDWSDVIDASGIVYEIQISTDSTFTTNIAYTTANLTSSSVQTTELSDGTYYWRVRAIDGANNVSPWSDNGSFQLQVKVFTGTPPDTDGQGDGGGSQTVDVIQSPGSTGPDDPISKTCFIKNLKLR